MRICSLCLSPYKDEILAQYGRGIRTRAVYEKYRDLMKLEVSQEAFHKTVLKHIKEQHDAKNLALGQTVYEMVQKKASLEGVVDKLTNLADLKVNSMKPEDVKLRDVFSGHKVLIESRKLKLTEDAMEIAMTKLFGPPVIQGEVVISELESDGHGEDSGHQPPGTQ